jgi:MFS transporter, PAT family, beta-lactamase induction signal transducer AmpG
LTTQRKLPPIWMMGLTNATFGIMGSLAVIILPQLLAAQGISGGHIAAITAAIISPGFWVFIFAPMLDVRFRRRTYALFFGFLTALGAAYTVLHHSDPVMVEAVMIAAYVGAAFYQGAVGGWMGSLIGKEHDSLLGTWFTVANVGVGGAFTVFLGRFILHWPPVYAALLMFLVLLLPMVFFFFIPAPPPDKLLASESFGRFFRELGTLLKRREVLIGLALFVLPSASFALTNVLAGIGKDYHASDNIVTFLAGTGTVIAGVGGSFLVPLLAKKIPLRPLYLAIGIVGGCFTLSTLLLPREPWTFGIVFTGEIVFQALAFAAANGITFEIIGPGNPLAATLFTLLIAAMNLPITYMGFADGWGLDKGGLVGGFAVDAGLSMTACLLLAIVLRKWLFAPHPKSASA